MKAVQFHRYGSAEALEVRDVPPPVAAANEALVRVAAASVNPKDTFIRKGRFRRYTGEHFPQPMGFDFAGTVAHIGAGAQGLAVGNRVWGMLDGWRGAACAEYVAVPARGCGRMPDGLDFVAGAGMPLAGSTAL